LIRLCESLFLVSSAPVTWVLQHPGGRRYTTHIYIYIYLFLLLHDKYLILYIYIWSFYPTSRGMAQLWPHFYMFASAFKTGPTVDKTEGPRMQLRLMCRRYSYACTHLSYIGHGFHSHLPKHNIDFNCMLVPRSRQWTKPQAVHACSDNTK